MACASEHGALRPFADRAVAWSEHDDENVPRRPEARGLEDENTALYVRDYFTREADRLLSFEGARPAADVNAADEVPCSTWFCARNHLRPMAGAEVAAGPPGDPPPVLPFTVDSGKARGAAPGFVAKDATGRKYLVKLDAAGHAGLATGAEVIGSRILHAAGYNVAGAFVVDLDDAELRVSPTARLRLSGVVDRPMTSAVLAEVLRGAARTRDGRLRAVAVNWIKGKVLGAFDMQGRRPDDPNDRIPHQDRRSLRASRVLFGWLNVEDASALNTLDSYVEENGRRFVRHYLIDFGYGLGSASLGPKSVLSARERFVDVGRIAVAAVTLGIYQRSWQRDVELWKAHAGGPPDVGWFYPVETWTPDEFRTGRKVPAHLRMTARDAYWGAKVVTSFNDAQVAAAVSAARYPPASARAIEHALRVRRDRIGEAYLLAYAAIERPSLSGDHALCFDDLAIERRYATPAGTLYHVEVRGDDGAVLGRWQAAPGGARTCLTVAAYAGRPYLVVSVGATVAGTVRRPTEVHVRWRSSERRFVVVGIHRED